MQVSGGHASERELAYIRDAAPEDSVVSASQLDVFHYNTRDTIYSHLMSPLVRDSRKAHHTHSSICTCFTSTRPMVISRADEVDRQKSAHRLHVVFTQASGHFCPVP